MAARILPLLYLIGLSCALEGTSLNAPGCLSTEFLDVQVNVPRCRTLTVCSPPNYETTAPTLTSDRVCRYSPPSMLNYLISQTTVGSLAEASEFCSIQGGCLAHPRTQEDLFAISNMRPTPTAGIIVGLQRPSSSFATCEEPYTWFSTGTQQSNSCNASGLWCEEEPKAGFYGAALWDPFMNVSNFHCLMSIGSELNASLGGTFFVACEITVCPFTKRDQSEYFNETTGLCMDFLDSCPPGFVLNASSLVLSDTVCVNGDNPSLHPCYYLSDKTCTPYSSPCDFSYQFESIPPSASSAAVCENVTVCIEGEEFELHAPTTWDDRLCELVSEPCDEQYESGFFELSPPTATTDRVCSEISSCPEWQVEVAPPTPFSDRLCSPCPAGSLKFNSTSCHICPAGSYVPNASQSSQCEDFACTAGSTDHDYDSSTPCLFCGTTAATQIDSTGPCPTDCLPGSFVAFGTCSPCPDQAFSLGGNVQSCTPWSSCPSQFFEVSPPTMSTDRVCEALSCGEFSILSLSPRCGANTVNVEYVFTGNLNLATARIMCTWWYIPCDSAVSGGSSSSVGVFSGNTIVCPMGSSASSNPKGHLRLSLSAEDQSSGLACSTTIGAPTGQQFAHLQADFECDTTAPSIPECPFFTLTTLDVQQTASLSRAQRTFTVVDDKDCDSFITLPMQEYPLGTTQYTLNATDSSNNTRVDACVGNVIVVAIPMTTTPPSTNISAAAVDREAPVVVCPTTAFSITIDENGTGVFPCVVNNTFTPLCSGASVTDNVGVVRLEQWPSANVTLSVPSSVVTLIARDAQNNTASCNITVLVVDDIPPTVVCPLPVVAYEDPVSLMRNVSVPIQASDNLSLRSVTITRLTPRSLVEHIDLSADFKNAVFRYNVTVAMEAGTSLFFILTARDGNNITGDVNTRSCTFQVTVERSQLTSALLSLESTPVSQLDPNIVKNFTASAANLSALQASIVISVVSQLATVVNASTAPTLFTALDNLNTLPVETIQASQSSTGGATRIREAILDLATAISAEQEGTVVLEGESLKIVTTTANASDLPTFSFSQNSTQPGAEPVFAATLEPSSLQVELNATRVAVLFSLFRDNRLFPSSEAAVLSSPVVDITIIGARLNGTLDFSVKPDVFVPSNPYLCVFWAEDTSRWNDSGLTTFINADAVDCSSVHLTNFAVLVDARSAAASGRAAHSEALSNITVVGCCLSLFGLVLTIGVHAGIRKLRQSVPSKLLLNLCSVLCVSLILFICATNVTSSRALCQAWGVLLHYSWLTAFGWMLVQGINMHAVCVIVLGLRFGRRLPAYYLLAYGAPLVIVALSVGIAGIDAYGDRNFCWINSQRVLVGGFLAPLAVVVVLNFFFFAACVRALHRAARKRRTDIGGLKTQSLSREIRAIVAIFVLLGLAWLFGAFVNVSDRNTSLAFQYLFALCVSLQGFTIFLLQCLFSDSVREQTSTSRSKSKDTSSKVQKLTAKQTGQIGIVVSSLYQDSSSMSLDDSVSNNNTEQGLAYVSAASSANAQTLSQVLSQPPLTTLAVTEEEPAEVLPTNASSLTYSVADAGELDRYLQTMSDTASVHTTARESQASAINSNAAVDSLQAFYDNCAMPGAVVACESEQAQPAVADSADERHSDSDSASASTPFDEYVDEMVRAVQPHPSAAVRQKISESRYMPFARQPSQPQPIAQVTITQVRNLKFSQLMQAWTEGAPASGPAASD